MHNKLKSLVKITTELYKEYELYEKIVFILGLIILGVTNYWYWSYLDDFDRMIFRAINSNEILKWLLYGFTPVMILWIIILIFSKNSQSSSSEDNKNKTANNLQDGEANNGSKWTYEQIAKLTLAYSRNPDLFDEKGKGFLKDLADQNVEKVSTGVNNTTSSVPNTAISDNNGGNDKYRKLKIAINLSFAILALCSLCYLSISTWKEFTRFKNYDLAITKKIENGKPITKEVFIKKAISWRYQFLMDDIIEKKLDRYNNNRKEVNILKELANVYKKDSTNVAKKPIKPLLKAISIRWNNNETYKKEENIDNIQKTIDELK